MKTRTLLFGVIIIFCCAHSTQAQDIHWSQFNDNPIFQNPANSGRFVGTYRFYANYRDQWRSVTVPFSTLSISADTKIQKVKNLGLGVLFFHDVAGDGKLRTIELQISPSYNLKLSADSVKNLRFGVQLGMNNRQLVFDDLFWDSQFNGSEFDPSMPSNENFSTLKKTNFSTGIGAVYEWSKSTRKRFSVGIGWFNINAPNQGFLGQKVQRDRRLNFFSQGQFKLNEDWDLLPTFQLNFQGKYNEIIFGSNIKYLLKDRLQDYIAFYLGGFFRNKDSGYLSVGMDYGNWFAGASYDFNFSKLVPASRARGGIEFSLRYILNNFKPKNILHRICPDYI